MKKNIVKIIIISMMVIAPVISFAGGWTPWSQVNLVYTQSNGRVHMVVAPAFNHINPDACIAKSCLVLYPENAAYKEIYQLLLTAKAANTNIRVY